MIKEIKEGFLMPFNAIEWHDVGLTFFFICLVILVYVSVHFVLTFIEWCKK